MSNPIEEFIRDRGFWPNFAYTSIVVIGGFWGGLAACRTILRKAWDYQIRLGPVRGSAIAAVVLLVGMYVGWQCGLGAPDRNAAGLKGGNTSVEVIEGDPASDGDASDKQNQGEIAVRHMIRRPVAGDRFASHQGVPLESFEALDNGDYKCRLCGKVGKFVSGMEGVQFVEGAAPTTGSVIRPSFATPDR